MSDRIAVGVSDTGASNDALRWSVRRASRTSADLVLLHVLDEGDTASGGEGPRGPEVRRLLLRELRSARTESPVAEVRIRTVRGGIMWQLIAASGEFDLLAVGTHKTGFIHGTLYGSTSLPLASAGACPVVVVPAPSRDDSRGVVLGADDSAAGLAALGFAATEAARTGHALTIVRVSPVSTDRLDDLDLPERRSVDLLLDELAALAREMHPGLTIRTRSLQGSTAELLVAASSSAALLVLGDARTASAAPRALGAVCHDALMNIRVPTAIVHGGDTGPASEPEGGLETGRPLRALDEAIRP